MKKKTNSDAAAELLQSLGARARNCVARFQRDAPSGSIATEQELDEAVRRGTVGPVTAEAIRRLRGYGRS